jgi:hypothetical protein
VTETEKKLICLLNDIFGELIQQVENPQDYANIPNGCDIESLYNMVLALKQNVNAWSVNKCNQWLGCIQGIGLAIGIWSIEKLEKVLDQSKDKLELPSDHKTEPHPKVYFKSPKQDYAMWYDQ